jgi:hypothetical protein
MVQRAGTAVQSCQLCDAVWMSAVQVAGYAELLSDANIMFALTKPDAPVAGEQHIPTALTEAVLADPRTAMLLNRIEILEQQLLVERRERESLQARVERLLAATA